MAAAVRAAPAQIDEAVALARRLHSARAHSSDRDRTALPTLARLRAWHQQWTSHGFAATDVEAALAAVGRQTDAPEAILEHLCLHATASVPEAFQAGLCAEARELQDKGQLVETCAHSSAQPATSAQSSAHTRPAAATPPPVPTEQQRLPSPTPAADLTASAPDAAWVMQYLAAASSSDEDDDLNDPLLQAGINRPQAGKGKQSKKAGAGKPGSGLDLNAQYAELTARAAALKAEAAAAKTAGDRNAQRDLGRQIGDVQRQLAEARKHPKFDQKAADALLASSPAPVPVPAPVPKAAEADNAGANAEAAAAAAAGSAADTAAAPPEDDDMDLPSGGLDSLFDTASDDPASAPSPSSASSSAVPLLDRDLTLPPSWTGKSPRDLLAEYLGSCKAPRPRFVRMDGGPPGAHLYAATVATSARGKPFDVPAGAACHTKREAQNLAATAALYRLCPDKPIHRRLPGPFQEVWAGWQKRDREAELAAKGAEVAPREAFLQRLLEEWTAEEQAAAAKSSSSADIIGSSSSAAPESAQETTEAAAEDQPAEDWEALASDDETPTDASAPAPASFTRTGVAACKRDPEFVRLLRRSREAQAKPGTAAHRCASQRDGLPVLEHATSIAQHVATSPAVLICGETGCGKSTQVGRILLEDAATRSSAPDPMIICCQPRRISAMSIADRVCDEMGLGKPGADTSLCGYQVRLEKKAGRHTRLLFCTYGILLRRLQADPSLRGVTHVIMDEVHERSIDSDFLCLLLRQLLDRDPNFRLVLMSASVDPAKFTSYFQDCPVLNIPGRIFPVDIRFLEDAVEETGFVMDEDSPYARRRRQYGEGMQRTQVAVSGRGGRQHKVSLEWELEADEAEADGDDETGGALVLVNGGTVSPRTAAALQLMDSTAINYDLIQALILHVEDSGLSEDGSVLVFLPGAAEIHACYNQLLADRRLGDPSLYLVIPLHSQLSTEAQRQAFESPPRGIRKVVLSTNIAETGVTIPDVVVVVDTGRVKEARGNFRVKGLKETWISKASAKQRAGRAGRVRSGVVFRLYAQATYQAFAAHTKPEMQRVGLEPLVLQASAMFAEADPAELLSQAIDPPSTPAVNLAVKGLAELGALVEREQQAGGPRWRLTALGRRLAQMPIEARMGKLVLLGAMHGCLEPILTIAAILGYRSPFVAPVSRRSEAHSAYRSFARPDDGSQHSDLLLLLNAFTAWEQAKRSGRATQFCRQNFLSAPVLVAVAAIREDLRRLVRSMGLSSSEREAASAELDRNTRNRLVRGVIVGALYPQVGQWPAPTLPDGRKVSPATVELRGGSRAKLHPSSVLHPRGQDAPAASAWLCFSERVQTSQVFLRDNTLVSPTALLLFGGSSSASSSSSNVGLEIVPEHRVVALPGQRAWMAFDCAPQLAVALRVLRRRLDQLVDADLSRGEGDEGLEDSAGGALQPADEDERRDLRIAILGLL